MVNKASGWRPFGHEHKHCPEKIWKRDHVPIVHLVYKKKFVLGFCYWPSWSYMHTLGPRHIYLYLENKGVLYNNSNNYFLGCVHTTGMPWKTKWCLHQIIFRQGPGRGYLEYLEWIYTKIYSGIGTRQNPFSVDVSYFCAKASILKFCHQPCDEQWCLTAWAKKHVYMMPWSHVRGPCASVMNHAKSIGGASPIHMCINPSEANIKSKTLSAIRQLSVMLH